MPTHLWDKSDLIPNVPRAKQLVVNKERQVESLADYVRRVRNEKRLSLADVEAQAKRAGHGIGRTHINRIENGFIDAEGVTPKRLRALAAGLGVPEDDVFNAARGISSVSEDDLEDDEEVAALFFNYTKLTEDDKRELRSVLRMLDEEIKRRNLKPKKRR